MDILALRGSIEDPILVNVEVIDTYESLIWTERYDECGDFELYLPADKAPELLLGMDTFLWWPGGSDVIMIVEKVLSETDAENGSRVTISGRSIESILERRIIWGLKTINGNLQDAIEELLNENAISPSDPNRTIPNLTFARSSDPLVTGATVEAQYTGENLYTAIVDLCKKANLGFRIRVGLPDMTATFSLYAGADRSYAQLTNPSVVFSPRYDNLINSNFVNSRTTLKNVTLIGGEGEGSERVFAEYDPNSSSGFERREIFTDAASVSSKVEDQEEPMTPEEYESLLVNEGMKTLSQNKETFTFEGEVDANVMFKYYTDFFMGDIVQLDDEHGRQARVRVSEYIFSDDNSGTSFYPTFKAITEEEDQ